MKFIATRIKYAPYDIPENKQTGQKGLKGVAAGVWGFKYTGEPAIDRDTNECTGYGMESTYLGAKTASVLLPAFKRIQEEGRPLVLDLDTDVRNKGMGDERKPTVEIVACEILGVLGVDYECRAGGVTRIEVPPMQAARAAVPRPAVAPVANGVGQRQPAPV